MHGRIARGVLKRGEWGNNGIKAAFARLQAPQDKVSTSTDCISQYTRSMRWRVVTWQDKEKRALVFRVICKLHNLRVRTLGQSHR